MFQLPSRRRSIIEELYLKLVSYDAFLASEPAILIFVKMAPLEYFFVAIVM